MNLKEVYNESEWHCTYIGYQIYEILAKEKKADFDDNAIAESQEFMD